MKFLVLTLSSISILFSSGFSASIIECVNIPTAEVIDYGIGEISVRLYTEGGVISRIIFAPFNRLNFGGSINIENLVGTKEPIIRDPQFYFKWRIFDGTKYFPAVAVGYDGQGYNYDAILKRYYWNAKGLFMVFSMNLYVSGLFTDLGVNMMRINEKNKPLGFCGLRYTLENIFSISTEYENIGDTDLYQVNGGISFLLAKTISLELIFRNLYSKSTESTEIDRQIRINYFYKFF